MIDGFWIKELRRRVKALRREIGNCDRRIKFLTKRQNCMRDRISETQKLIEEALNE